jgi:hypothetical protein
MKLIDCLIDCFQVWTLIHTLGTIPPTALFFFVLSFHKRTTQKVHRQIDTPTKRI